jgi:hypothetical protein
MASCEWDNERAVAIHSGDILDQLFDYQFFKKALLSGVNERLSLRYQRHTAGKTKQRKTRPHLRPRRRIKSLFIGIIMS